WKNSFKNVIKYARVVSSLSAGTKALLPARDPGVARRAMKLIPRRDIWRGWHFCSPARRIALRRAFEPRFNSALEFRLRATGMSPTAPASERHLCLKFV